MDVETRVMINNLTQDIIDYYSIEIPITDMSDVDAIENEFQKKIYNVFSNENTFDIKIFKFPNNQGGYVIQIHHLLW